MSRAAFWEDNPDDALFDRTSYASKPLAGLAPASLALMGSTPPPRFERGPIDGQSSILPLDHGSTYAGGFVSRRRIACVIRELSPRGSTEWGGPESNGHLGVWSSAGYRCRHRPGGPRARVERASRGPRPRILPLNDRGHECRRSRGSASRWGDSNSQGSCLQDKCQSRSGVSGSQPPDLQNAESPGYLSFWSYATYDGADLVVLCRVASDSPESVEAEGCNESSDSRVQRSIEGYRLTRTWTRFDSMFETEASSSSSTTVISANGFTRSSSPSRKGKAPPASQGRMLVSTRIWSFYPRGTFWANPSPRTHRPMAGRCSTFAPIARNQVVGPSTSGLRLRPRLSAGTNSNSRTGGLLLARRRRGATIRWAHSCSSVSGTKLHCRGRAERRRPESHRVLPINGRGLDSRATPAWSRPESDRDYGVFSAALSRVELRLRSGRGRIRTCDGAFAPAGLKVPGLRPLGYASVTSRAGIAPAQGGLRVRCPCC